MTAHVHADMICAKAQNMDLILFFRQSDNDSWKEASPDQLPINQSDRVNYFLCFDKHKGAVFNLLNRGSAEFYFEGMNDWREVDININEWGKNYWYMDSKVTSRIKPRKVNRWIIITENGYEYYSKTEPSTIPEGSTIRKIELGI